MYVYLLIGQVQVFKAIYAYTAQQVCSNYPTIAFYSVCDTCTYNVFVFMFMCTLHPLEYQCVSFYRRMSLLLLKETLYMYLRRLVGIKNYIVYTML